MNKKPRYVGMWYFSPRDIRCPPQNYIFDVSDTSDINITLLSINILGPISDFLTNTTRVILPRNWSNVLVIFEKIFLLSTLNIILFTDEDES